MGYYKPLPVDKNRNALQQQPAALRALASYGDENGAASSVITLTDDTTDIEVAAVGGPAAIRWVTTADTQASVVTAVSGANFDHVIGTGTVRRFAVPKESGGTHSVVGANIQQGLYRRVAAKSIGTASVLLTEY